MEAKQFTIGTSMALLVLIIIGMSNLHVAESRPSISDGWLEYHNRFGIAHDRRASTATECANSSRETRELCQRCAKVTKSKLAYPMCCEGREDATNWCRELLAFG